MHVMFSSLPTLAVSAIYCVWHAYQKEKLRRDRVLRERVAYMLWVATERVE